MATTSEAEVLARLMQPLSRELNAELSRALIGLHADEQTQARYDDLAERRTGGLLSHDEEEELAAMVRANTLLGILKAQSHAFLQRTDPK